MNGRILLVEDDELIGSMVRLNLESDGYAVEWLREGRPALAKSRAADADLVILDIMLPDTDGVRVARSLREVGVVTPILMLTAKAGVDTKIEALDAGADDYLTKPFDIGELAARARALIRRSQGQRHLASSDRLQIGRYVVHLQSREATTREGDVALTPKEVELLEYFHRHQGVTRSRADILEEVWGMEVYVSERTIDNFIVRFRKLFEDDPDAPKLFMTVRGVGYRYVAGPTAS
ncbi:MAG: response regulator transcription factor [Deltaproteobacteria bacterium]|nr:response regulator transcription factor [Deltaproteobacteria bacterium]